VPTIDDGERQLRGLQPSSAVRFCLQVLLITFVVGTADRRGFVAGVVSALVMAIVFVLYAVKPPVVRPWLRNHAVIEGLMPPVFAGGSVFLVTAALTQWTLGVCVAVGVVATIVLSSALLIVHSRPRTDHEPRR
jgi:hypothetical protein